MIEGLGPERGLGKDSAPVQDAQMPRYVNLSTVNGVL